MKRVKELVVKPNGKIMSGEGLEYSQIEQIQYRRGFNGLGLRVNPRLFLYSGSA